MSRIQFSISAPERVRVGRLEPAPGWREQKGVAMSRSELFLTAVDILQAGRSIDLVGEHGSGRSHLLRRVRDHFTALGWRTVNITGVEAFRRAPLAALALAGLVDNADARSASLVSAYTALSAQVAKGRTVVLVDDSDSLDEASWGVINAVATQLGAPTLTARLRNRPLHAPAHPTSGFSAVHTIELPAMSYSELEDSLEQTLGYKLDAGTMSRVFAKSGGNVGLAAAIVEGARRAGALTVEDGVGRATDTLWTRSLQAIIDVVLQPLDRADVDVLRTLALLGPAEFTTVTKVVDAGTLIRLEELGFVSLVETAPFRHVAVNPPLLVEHFRHDATPAQRAALLERIDGSLAETMDLVPEEPVAQDAAVFVRLVHEQARKVTLRAREAWRAHQNLATATGLLSALEADTTPNVEEVAALLAAVPTLAGTTHERAEWYATYARHLAHHDAQIDDAIALLHSAARELPGSAIYLRACATVIELNFGPVGTNEPFVEVDLDECDDETRAEVLIARALWFLVRGRASEAEELLIEHSSWGGDTPRIDALVVYTQLALGNFELAARVADDKLTLALASLDGRQIRIYAFLSALAALFERRMADAETAMRNAVTLGLPLGEAPTSYIGITLMGAYFAVKRGQRALMNEYLAELDGSGLPSGTLPGLHPAFVLARLELLDGNYAGAAGILVDAGDELWKRGALLAAAYNYIDAVRADPTAKAWRHIAPRLAKVDSPAVQKMAVFAKALVEADGPALVREVQRVEHGHNHAEAVYLARLATRIVEANGADPETLDRLAEVIRVSRGELSSVDNFIDLTRREEEVAELVASGLTNPMIAEALVVSVRTVESHVNRLIKKIGAKRRQDIREFLLAREAAR